MYISTYGIMQIFSTTWKHQYMIFQYDNTGAKSLLNQLKRTYVSVRYLWTREYHPNTHTLQ